MKKHDVAKKMAGGTGGGFKEGKCVNCGRSISGKSCPRCNSGQKGKGSLNPPFRSKENNSIGEGKNEQENA